MTGIFDTIFEEVTFFKWKTNTVFLEDYVYTLQDKHGDLEIAGPQKDVIHNNYAGRL